jgi:aminoglycoside phosphotransferase (APT) family kinase protein
MAQKPRDSIRKQLKDTAPGRFGGASRTLPAAAARSDRASRFLARLDTHLPIISDRPARCAFLDRQLEGWERRYARFLATEGASEPAADPADPPQAADFLLTNRRPGGAA